MYTFVTVMLSSGYLVILTVRVTHSLRTLVTQTALRLARYSDANEDLREGELARCRISRAAWACKPCQIGRPRLADVWPFQSTSREEQWFNASVSIGNVAWSHRNAVSPSAVRRETEDLRLVGWFERTSLQHLGAYINGQER